MKKTRKPLAIVVASALVAALGIGSTVAWLTDQSDKVENTFTVGNINIELAETDATETQDGLFEKSYRMVPGDILAKDPTITVQAGSEKCYLFVQVEKTDNFGKYLTYGMVKDWEELTGVDGVYYQVVNASDEPQEFGVLLDDQVAVNTGVTKADMEELTEETYPSISFKAYAVQYANIADVNSNGTAADEAWDEVA